ncbi:hypothetical protein ACH427_31925 [Streptomyces sp. NPDC020379]|uniref:hypothetical protein n=1 Tax=Streptomyces sp. NPDC020379 TaxID=3365071 RepID=UPI0037A4AFA7
MNSYPEARSVRICAPRPDTPVTIEVDGHDVASGVEAYRITQTVDGDPEVTLYIQPGWKSLEFKGMAEVVVEPADLRHVVHDCLGSIDRRQLDTAVPARDELDGEPGELTRGVLSQLREWAAGA